MTSSIESTAQLSRTCGRCRRKFALDHDADPWIALDWWACPPCRAVLLPNRKL